MEPGEDWRAEIEAMFEAAEGNAAWFSAFGGVKAAEVSFYDQSDCSYGPATFDEPMEVASCTGNIARIGDDGPSYAHTHAVLARANGELVAGHLNAASVFVGEVYLRTFDVALTRKADETPVLRTDEDWREHRNEGDRETDSVTGLEIWR